jgi:hypothetical protein
MFELHVVVAGFVMLNILELIMEIVPNYPTGCPGCILLVRAPVNAVGSGRVVLVVELWNIDCTIFGDYIESFGLFI